MKKRFAHIIMPILGILVIIGIEPTSILNLIWLTDFKYFQRQT